MGTYSQQHSKWGNLMQIHCQGQGQALHCTASFSESTWSTGWSNEAREENWGDTNRERRSQISLSTDNMTLDIGESQNSTRKLLEMMHKFHQYGSIQKSQNHLAEINSFSIHHQTIQEREHGHPFRIASKRKKKKYLEINLTKEVKNFYIRKTLSFSRKR